MQADACSVTAHLQSTLCYVQRARNILSSAPFLIPLVSGSSPSFLYILRIPLRSAFPSFQCASSSYDIPLTIPASFPLLRYDSYVTIPFLPRTYGSLPRFHVLSLVSAYSGFPHFPYLVFPDFPYSTVYLVYKAVA